MVHRNELLFALATGLAAVAAIVALPSLVAKPKMLFGRSLSAMEPSLFPHITLVLIVAMSCLLIPFAIRGILRTTKTVNDDGAARPLTEKPAFKVTIFFVVLGVSIPYYTCTCTYVRTRYETENCCCWT